MSTFRFKQFKIEQENSAMKVNTDGVLLGAWMSILPTDHTLLDVGTGSGVIALMAAQRLEQLLQQLPKYYSVQQKEERWKTDVLIAAIDIDKASYEDAANNFANSPWSCVEGEAASHVNIVLDARVCSFQELAALYNSQDALDLITATNGGNASDYEAKRYDLIFSNPPYFINSLKSPNSTRSNTRHTDTLSQSELLRCAVELLVPGGRLALVLPAAEAELLLEKVAFIREHTKNGENVLHLSRLCKVRTTERKPAKRYLMEFVFTAAELIIEVQESELVMQKGPAYTDEYRSLTKDFYLNF